MFFFFWQKDVFFRQASCGKRMDMHSPKCNTHHYGLIHAKYQLSTGTSWLQLGIVQMIKKYQADNFADCLRVYCENQAMLTISLSDIPGEAMVKLYCPKCMDVYTPKSSRYHHTDAWCTRSSGRSAPQKLSNVKIITKCDSIQTCVLYFVWAMLQLSLQFNPLIYFFPYTQLNLIITLVYLCTYLHFNPF